MAALKEQLKLLKKLKKHEPKISALTFAQALDETTHAFSDAEKNS